MNPSLANGFCASEAARSMRVEQAAVVDHREDRLLHQRLALLHRQPAAQLQDQLGDVDLARADLLAVAALDAEALDVLGLLQLVEPGREDGADAAGVDLAEHVPAHQAEDRADVQAGGAADALQRLLELRVVAPSACGGCP